jgi:hypothetical protein
LGAIHDAIVLQDEAAVATVQRAAHAFDRDITG